MDILFFENDHLNNEVASHPEEEEDQQKDDFREYANLELELNWKRRGIGGEIELLAKTMSLIFTPVAEVRKAARNPRDSQSL